MTFNPHLNMPEPPWITSERELHKLCEWTHKLWYQTWQIWFLNYASRMADVEAYEIATEEGIQGGGLLSDDLTLKLDINGLSVDASPDSAADYIVTYDSSAGLHKKVLISALPTSGGQSGTSSVTFADTFGDGTEATLASVTVAAPWVTATSVISAWVTGDTTVDHDPEDGLVEQLVVNIQNIVDGVSFDIVVFAPNGALGEYNVAYMGTP